MQKERLQISWGWMLGVAESGSNTYYFRGTTEGYAGNSALQRLGITPTSTDSLVSTVFATNGEQYGKGVLYK